MASSEASGEAIVLAPVVALMSPSGTGCWVGPTAEPALIEDSARRLTATDAAAPTVQANTLAAVARTVGFTAATLSHSRISAG